MDDDERQVMMEAIAYHNRMVGYFHEFLRERETGEQASVNDHDVLKMFDEVQALRRKVSRVQVQLLNRNLWPIDDIASYLGSTWRLLTGPALGGKVRLVPHPLELREPKLHDPGRKNG